MIRRAHHIDFVVRDLDDAVERYSRVLGTDPGPRERLPDRGVELVRFDVDNLWIVLVQPVRDDSPVKAFLEEHGEGFFHIAFQVDDVAAEAERLEQAEIELINREPRLGVEGWKLVDVAISETFGVYTQLVEQHDD